MKIILNKISKNVIFIIKIECRVNIDSLKVELTSASKYNIYCAIKIFF